MYNILKQQSRLSLDIGIYKLNDFCQQQKLRNEYFSKIDISLTSSGIYVCVDTPYK